MRGWRAPVGGFVATVLGCVTSRWSPPADCSPRAGHRQRPPHQVVVRPSSITCPWSSTADLSASRSHGDWAITAWCVPWADVPAPPAPAVRSGHRAPRSVSVQQQDRRRFQHRARDHHPCRCPPTTRAARGRRRFQVAAIRRQTLQLQRRLGGGGTLSPRFASRRRGGCPARSWHQNSAGSPARHGRDRIRATPRCRGVRTSGAADVIVTLDGSMSRVAGPKTVVLPAP